MPLTTVLDLLMEGVSLLFMITLLVQFQRIHSRRTELLVSLGVRERQMHGMAAQKHAMIVAYVAMTTAITVISIGIAFLWPSAPPFP